MKTMRMSAVAASLLLVAGTASFGAATPAESTGWQFELTPYAWLAGVDGTATIKGQKHDFSQKFSDLVKNVDFGGSLLGRAQYDRWVTYGQFDYFRISQDDTGPNGVSGTITSDSAFYTVAGGYQFDGPFEGSKIDVLGGVKIAHQKTEAEISGGPSASDTRDLVDGVLMLRPSIPLFPSKIDGLRFNPTVSIGAGDSDLVYDLMPNFQYDFTDSISGRIGYRRMHYKVTGDNDNELDISFSGMILGVGITF